MLQQQYSVSKNSFSPQLSTMFLSDIWTVWCQYYYGFVNPRGSDTVCSSAHAKCDNLALSTKAEAEKALTGIDTSGLRESFSHALSFSIPPLALYCNHRPAYSDLVFGVPLVGFAINQDNVPKAIRMCLEEVEKRGLDAHKIYSVS